jgi:hypothetical protein
VIKADGTIPHGTAGGYTNHGCKCAECKRAFAQASARSAQKRRERGLPPGDERHGTLNGYGNWGCRCDECTAAKAADKKAQQKIAS